LLLKILLLDNFLITSSILKFRIQTRLSDLFLMLLSFSWKMKWRQRISDRSLNEWSWP